MNIFPKNEQEQRVMDLDLEPHIVKLVSESGEGWSLDYALKVEKQYRAFLMLYLRYPDGNHIPTKSIDTFWHTHILDTRKYMEDCDAIFGCYFHHFPYMGMRGEADAQYAQQSFDETVNLFQNEFGLDISIKRHPAEQHAASCSGQCTGSCSGGGDTQPPSKIKFDRYKQAGQQAAACNGTCTGSCSGGTAPTPPPTKLNAEINARAHHQYSGAHAASCSGNCTGSCSGGIDRRISKLDSGIVHHQVASCSGNCTGSCSGGSDRRITKLKIRQTSLRNQAEQHAASCSGNCTGSCSGGSIYNNRPTLAGLSLHSVQ